MIVYPGREGRVVFAVCESGQCRDHIIIVVDLSNGYTLTDIFGQYLYNTITAHNQVSCSVVSGFLCLPDRSTVAWYQALIALWLGYIRARLQTETNIQQYGSY